MYDIGYLEVQCPTSHLHISSSVFVYENMIDQRNLDITTHHILQQSPSIPFQSPSPLPSPPYHLKARNLSEIKKKMRTPLIAVDSRRLFHEEEIGHGQQMTSQWKGSEEENKSMRKITTFAPGFF